MEIDDDHDSLEGGINCITHKSSGSVIIVGNEIGDGHLKACLKTRTNWANTTKTFHHNIWHKRLGRFSQDTETNSTKHRIGLSFNLAPFC